MIKAVMYWNRMRLEVEGHANTAPKGSDLVCAGVSMLTAALIGILEDAEARGRMIQGWKDTGQQLSIWADPKIGNTVEMKSYFKMCVKGLQMLQEQYPKNVEIREVY